MPAQAQDGWLSQEVARLAALPHTLQAVQDNKWLQISIAQQRQHPGAEEAYRDVKPSLDALAEAARPNLEHELDSILHRLTYVGLQAIVRQHPPDYCSWIGTTRPDGIPPSPSDLQAQLLAHCRAAAGDVVTRLLEQHIDAIDLHLAALPGLDLAFPRALLGDLPAPDAAGHAAIDALVSQQAYQDRLSRRIAAAAPPLRQEMDRLYSTRRWSGGPLTAPGPDCSGLLGPLSGGELTAYCVADATRWLTSIQPALIAAIPAAIAGLPGQMQPEQEAELCQAVLSRWMPGEGYPELVQAAVTDACLREAGRAIARAVAERARAIASAILARATSLAAPILGAPPTYESLLAHAWFSQPSAAWDGIVPSSDQDAAGVRGRVQSEYLRLIAFASAAAVTDAKKQIDLAYADAAGRTTAIRDTRVLCGADGRGGGLPQGHAAAILRDQVVSACTTAFETFKAARTRVTLGRAGIRADDQIMVVVPVDGEDAHVLLRDLITRAGAAGLQVRYSAGVLGFGARLTISPVGAETPVLAARVSRDARGLRLDGIDPFPGWPADTFNTIACATSDGDDLANAQFVAILTVMGSFFAYDTDRPRTAGHLLREGLNQLQDVQNRRACPTARQAFIDQAPNN